MPVNQIFPVLGQGQELVIGFSLPLSFFLSFLLSLPWEFPEKMLSRVLPEER